MKMQIIDVKNVVEKQNLLNEIKSNHMTLQEIRFFTIYLSKINSRDISTRVVRFPLKDFVKILEIGKVNISNIKTTTDRLLCKIVNITQENGGYIGFQLFKECRLDKDKNNHWFVEIDAHDRALPLMFEFKKNYFRYELWNTLRLTSVNQIRMYEILKQYEKLGWREVSIDGLKEYLGVKTDQYSRFGDFKYRVLNPIQKALKEVTDLKYEYELIKKGAKVIAVKFIIEKNEDYIDQMTLEEFLQMRTIEIQDDLYKEKQKFKNDNLEFLADACNNEFSEEDMQVIFDIVSDIITSKEKKDTSLARYNYLCKKYNELNQRDTRKDIDTVKNRLSYFKAILKSDLKNKEFV